MWLINVATYRLRFFNDNEIPPYGILSHRWSNQEVSFANLRACDLIDDGLSASTIEEKSSWGVSVLYQRRQNRLRSLERMQGWTKVKRLCKLALENDLHWAWIDTVCIDKSSSAELQEAVNSMYWWYYNADKCFVYMGDVKASQATDANTLREQFRASSWFTRGWTLQELLAPETGKLTFWNCEWEYIGPDVDLAEDISSATGIPGSIINRNGFKRKEDTIAQCSIAQRMSWAAHRNVTREEDVAYCLLGIFEVNMPLLYGEGARKAFQRLQQEIIKQSTDESILICDCSVTSPLETEMGLLAHSPANFAKSDQVVSISTWSSMIPVGEFPELGGNFVGSQGHSLQATTNGFLLDAVVIERDSDTAISNMLQKVEAWTTQCAVPLLCGIEDSDKRYRSFFLQLERWGSSRNEYFKKESPFLAHLDWSDVGGQYTSERIFIRSAFNSCGLFGLQRHKPLWERARSKPKMKTTASTKISKDFRGMSISNK